MESFGGKLFFLFISYARMKKSKCKTEGRYMSLQLIIGGAGSGKSYHLYQDIIKESMKHPNQNYLVLVPEHIHLLRTGIDW